MSWNSIVNMFISSFFILVNLKHPKSSFFLTSQTSFQLFLLLHRRAETNRHQSKANISASSLYKDFGCSDRNSHHQTLQMIHINMLSGVNRVSYEGYKYKNFEIYLFIYCEMQQQNLMPVGCLYVSVTHACLKHQMTDTNNK